MLHISNLILASFTAVILGSCRSNAQLRNSLGEFVQRSERYFHTAPFVKIPNDEFGIAKIICITHFRGAMYVCQQRKIYRVDMNDRSVTLFLDVAAAISAATNGSRNLNIESEMHGGLRSVAFHPSYRRCKLYVSVMEDRPEDPSQHHYISDVDNATTADSVLLEFTADSKFMTADPLSYREVFRVGISIYDHPIKQIAFKRRLLYIAHGDAADQFKPAGGGQNADALGKILRIDPLKIGRFPYSVPFSNPFVFDRASGMPIEVWALGFRNPHHICFERNGRGLLFSAETGSRNVEEVNLIRRGRNYGWSLREGPFVHLGRSWFGGVGPLPEDDASLGLTYPAAALGHEGVGRFRNGSQAIAGGCVVYNRSPMRGLYFYGDFPRTGRLYYSEVRALKDAVTSGLPKNLTRATTFWPKLCFDDDDDPSTPPKPFDTLGEIVRSDPAFSSKNRADVRFGRGPGDVLYWSSKVNGVVYKFTSSEVDGPDERC